MRREDAVTICGIISDVITSRRGASLFPNGKDAAPSNLGAIWIDSIEKIPEEHAEIATRAAVELMTGMTEVPTITDFRAIFGKMQRDLRMKVPALPEPDFKRELPSWVKGKLVACARNDLRVWPEQKAGYDYLQRMNSEARSYVWGEQEKMPEDAQRKYIARGEKLTSADLAKLYEDIVGNLRRDDDHRTDEGG